MLRPIITAVLFFWMALPLAAQQTAWVQVEAQPTLSAAQDRVRSYAARLPDVAGFYLGGGWYGIVLGPYAENDAQALLRQLRAQGRIPSDSFIAFGNNFRQQYWPVGVAAETRPQPLPQEAEVETTAEPEAAPIIQVPDETQREARASERLLTREERETLQIALQWAGFYTAAIDGAFGRGTRRSMGEWQAANNHEVTGILTTGQRAELLGAYNAVLDGMDLTLVRETEAGIEIELPLGVVEFDEYAPPFARFAPSGDIPAQVLLISQPGDQDRLYGLYEIMQTLDIVPLDGPRERRRNSFVLEGANDQIASYTTATLDDGQIKGFTLIWPAGDEARRTRILGRMTDSFARIDGVLDPSIVAPDETQSVDLVSGLSVRQPEKSRTGFYISSDGAVLTTADVVGQCDRLTLDGAHAADVVLQDDTNGLAVLRPQSDLVPLGTAVFQRAVPRLQSRVAVAGYPYGGILNAPALTFGLLADLRGLDGNGDVQRLSLNAQPGDAGGPVFDAGGAVLGMLLPREDSNGQVLPSDVSFSLQSDVILGALAAAGIAAETTELASILSPELLSQRAADQTVLVSCW